MTDPTPPNAVREFRHGEAGRRNNPPAGIGPTHEVREGQARQYARDVHSDPQQQWAGKAERTSFRLLWEVGGGIGCGDHWRT